MIWHWLTVFSLAAGTLEAAGVSGRVELKDSRETSVRKRADYSGVAVWLEPLKGAAEAATGRARMLQKDKMFLPHVLAIQAGTTVDFPNADPIFHNAFSNYDGQIFDVGLYPPGSSRGVHFKRAGVVRVFCNIHADMSAVIVVAPGPWFEVTKADGAFDLKNVPPGEYRLQVFHERASEATLKALSRVVTVREGGLNLGVLTVSESGYLPVPHMNKHGQHYEAPPDGPLYPTVRK